MKVIGHMKTNCVVHQKIDTDSNAWLLLENNKFIDCNQTALELFKYSDKKQIIGKTPYDFSPEIQPNGELSKEKALKKIHQANRYGIARFNWIHKNRHGDLIPVCVQLEKIFQSNKEYLFARLFLNDSFPNYEKGRLNNIDEFQYLRKIATGLAHQINTPLGNIITTLSYLKSNQVIDKDEPYFLILEKSIEKLKILVHEIQESSFVTSTENLCWIDMKTLSRSLNIHFYDKYEFSDIHISFEINGLENIEFNCFLLEIIEVVERIVMNAIIHNPQKKVNVTISAWERDSSICLEIRNDGTKIPSDILKHIFDPFVTGNPGRNFGLGLFIANNIVKFLFNGRIQVSSNEEETVFTVILPCEIRTKVSLLVANHN